MGCGVNLMVWPYLLRSQLACFLKHKYPSTMSLKHERSNPTTQIKEKLLETPPFYLFNTVLVLNPILHTLLHLKVRKPLVLSTVDFAALPLENSTSILHGKFFTETSQ
jgi:hypothetical protein